MNSKSILLVDDDACYLHLVEFVLKSLGHKKIRSLQDPTLVLPVLTDPATRELPNLILMDVNMPQANGLKIARELKAHPRLMAIPVVIMSSDYVEETLNEAYRAGVNSCVKKPNDLQAFIETFKVITQYWLSLVLNPT